MKEWLRRFYNSNNEITLTLNGKTFKKSSCKRIDGGSEKNVYQLEGSKKCFFIPNKWRSEEDWKWKINQEKELLNQISNLGLRAQRFSISQLYINEPNQPSYSISVLVTNDFENLCKDESLLIHNYKGDVNIHGIAPDFLTITKQLKDKSFAQKMIKKIINDYAIACTFALPITILQGVDDSEHYCFELSDNPNEPPVVRYMFWDVVSDFSGLDGPLVPTLSNLKSGSNRVPLQGLTRLANSIACVISEIIVRSPNANERGEYYTFINEVKQDLILALNDDIILQEALALAREKGIKILNDKFNLISEGFKKITDAKDINECFIEFIYSAISVDSLDLVQRITNLCPDLNLLTIESINTILTTAKEYENPKIYDYLHTNLLMKKEELEANNLVEKKRLAIDKLKNDFLKTYKMKLTSDKESWCGLYSFFAKSKLNENGSLNDLVQHALGNSTNGSGKRSREVMKKMGWINDNNELTTEIREYALKM